MNDLPWELVAAIGDHLAPKWRCRLFICCKMWYRECYLIAKDIFTVYRNKSYVITDINSMQYNIVIDRYGCPLSKLIKSNNSTPVYSFCYYHYYGGIGCKMVVATRNKNKEFDLIDEYDKISVNYRNTNNLIFKYEFIARSYHLLSCDKFKRNVYNCLEILKIYINSIDMKMFIIAFGREFSYMFRRNCRLH